MYKLNETLELDPFIYTDEYNDFALMDEPELYDVVDADQEQERGNA